MISSLSKTSENNVVFVAQPSNGPVQFVAQLRQVLAANVAQLHSLQMTPDAFIGIEFRRITRQWLQLHALGSTIGQEVLNRLTTMDRCPIPNHQQFPFNMAQQMLQKAHHINAAIGPILLLMEQLTTHCNTTDCRDVLALEGHPQDRRLTSRGIGAHYTGQQRKARLIYKDDGSPVGFGPFFSAGQRSAYQAAILVSLRWVARRIGFCEVQRMARRRRLTCAGW